MSESNDNFVRGLYDREKAISLLVDLMFDEFNQGALSLTDIIIDGYRGLSDLSDEELMQELQDRDISYLFGDDDDHDGHDHHGQPDEAQEWYDFDPDA